MDHIPTIGLIERRGFLFTAGASLAVVTIPGILMPVRDPFKLSREEKSLLDLYVGREQAAFHRAPYEFQRLMLSMARNWESRWPANARIIREHRRALPGGGAGLVIGAHGPFPYFNGLIATVD